MIAINRNEGLKAMRKILNEVKKSIANGYSIIIFPEGEDPDSYSKNLSNEKYKSFLKNEMINFVDYKIVHMRQTPEIKVSITKDVLEQSGTYEPTSSLIA